MNGLDFKLDNYGNPQIIFYEVQSHRSDSNGLINKGELIHLYNNGDGWSYKIVDGNLSHWTDESELNSGKGIEGQTSIAIDSENNLHISYGNRGKSTLMYAHSSNGNWFTKEIYPQSLRHADTNGWSGEESSLSVDNSGNGYHLQCS